MRITENMMSAMYNRNLQRNVANLASSNLKLTSQRQYNHVSEDPAAAAKAFTVRDQIARSEEHINTVKNAVGELDTADSNIATINSILETVFEKATRAGGASSQDSLDAIAEALGGLKEEILQTMNARYGDKFLFSGSANGEAPFTLDADGMTRMIRLPILMKINRFIWILALEPTPAAQTRREREFGFPHRVLMCWAMVPMIRDSPITCTA